MMLAFLMYLMMQRQVEPCELPMRGPNCAIYYGDGETDEACRKAVDVWADQVHACIKAGHFTEEEFAKAYFGPDLKRKKAPSSTAGYFGWEMSPSTRVPGEGAGVTTQVAAPRVWDNGPPYSGEEPREYPAIKREQVHMMDWADCPIGFDQGSDVDGRLCTPNPRYTCKSPDTEVLEFTVSGRAFCRKVAP